MSHAATDQSEPASAERGWVIWLTGLPAAGKTTLAVELQGRLRAAGQTVVLLDGDVLRRGLCSDLGFSAQARAENIRRAAEIARLMADAGLVCVAALISPLAENRALARRLAGGDRFTEVYLATPLEVCRGRDAKGHYARAERGELANFTGVSAPYEPPANPEVTVYAEEESVEQAAEAILAFLQRAGKA